MWRSWRSAPCPHIFLFTALYSGTNTFYQGRQCCSAITIPETSQYLCSAGWLQTIIIQFKVNGKRQEKKEERKKKKSPVFIPQNNPTLPLQKLSGVFFQILFLICFTVGSHKLINHLCPVTDPFLCIYSLMQDILTTVSVKFYFTVMPLWHLCPSFSIQLLLILKI